MTKAELDKKEQQLKDALTSLRFLRGRVAKVMQQWLQSSMVVALGLPQGPTPKQQADRFPLFPPRTPKWVRQYASSLREIAERSAQVVWPAFTEPQPLPPVTKGRREGWSFDDVWPDARVFPSSVGPNVWSEMQADGTRGHNYSGVVPQYDTRLDALRAQHYAMLRRHSASLYESLMRCEEAAREV